MDLLIDMLLAVFHMFSGTARFGSKLIDQSVTWFNYEGNRITPKKTMNI